MTRPALVIRLFSGDAHAIAVHQLGHLTRREEHAVGHALYADESEAGAMRADRAFDDLHVARARRALRTVTELRGPRFRRTAA